jgi:prephenate dehydrogenase
MQNIAAIRTVAIAGVGLIGGSFGLALREAGFDGELLGVSSPPAIEAGLRSGAIQRAATLEEAAATADLIYLAQPVDRILQTLQQLSPLARPDCLITDAGSTKSVIVQQASDCIRLTTFLGGHPMAGKEQRGSQAAEAALFRGRPYVLTPDRPETSLTLEFRSWLCRIGANVIDMSAAEHDRVVAFTSHLPQLLSTALAATLALQNEPGFLRVFGPGLVDMTRLAVSTPDLWSSILATNQAEITLSINLFQDYLNRIKQAIATDDLVGVFDTGTRFASSIRKLASKSQD